MGLEEERSEDKAEKMKAWREWACDLLGGQGDLTSDTEMRDAIEELARERAETIGDIIDMLKEMPG